MFLRCERSIALSSEASKVSSTLSIRIQRNLEPFRATTDNEKSRGIIDCGNGVCAEGRVQTKNGRTEDGPDAECEDDGKLETMARQGPQII